MKVVSVRALDGRLLEIVSDDGRVGQFDIGPYLEFEAFRPLTDRGEFAKVASGGYFIEWNCGADLSADTIEAKWTVVGSVVAPTAA